MHNMLETLKKLAWKSKKMDYSIPETLEILNLRDKLIANGANRHDMEEVLETLETAEKNFSDMSNDIREAIEEVESLIDDNE